MTSNRYGAINRDYQSYSGPGDRDLPQSEVAGYQPASRIGEIVVNCFVRRPKRPKRQPLLL